MARPKDIDQRLVDFQVDIEADIKAREALSNAGINKPEDIMSGRADMARVGELLTKQNVNPEVQPALAEKIMRDRDFEDQLQNEPGYEQEQPQQEEPAESQVELTEIQKQAVAAKAEADRWKALYGRSENKVGEVRKRLAELEQRIQMQTPYVDARQVTGRGPDEYLTAQEVVNLEVARAQALGQQIRSLEDRLMAKLSKPEERIPTEVETELTEQYPWVAQLPDEQKERALVDLMKATTGATVTPPPPKPNVQTPRQAAQTERGRAAVRDAAFIEPSNRGSAAERTSVDPNRQALQQKIEQLRESLVKPGGSQDAEKILAALGAGLTDDYEANQFHRRR